MRSGNDAARMQLRVMLILWGAFLVACFTYAIVLLLVKSGSDADGAPEPDLWAVPRSNPVMAAALVFIAGMMIPMGIVVPSLIGRRNELANTAPAGRLQMVMIIRCAFFESIAIYGLVGAFVDCLSIFQSLIFMAVAAALLAFLLPWVLSEFEKIQREARRESLLPPR